MQVDFSLAGYSKWCQLGSKITGRKIKFEKGFPWELKYNASLFFIWKGTLTITSIQNDTFQNDIVQAQITLYTSSWYDA